MKKYIFIIGWFDGSDGACGEHTGVHSQDDLIPIHKGEKEGQVDSYEVHGKTQDQAMNEGYKKAFFHNFTAHDSCSTIMEA